MICLGVKTQLLLRLECVINEEGATHSQNDDVQSNRGSDLCAVPAQRPADSRYGVLSVLDLDVVDATLKYAEVCRLVLSGEGGSAGGWRYY